MFPIKYETDDTHCSLLPPETCDGPCCLVEVYICVLAHEALPVWPGSSCQPPLSLLSTSDFIPHCTGAFLPFPLTYPPLCQGENFHPEQLSWFTLQHVYLYWGLTKRAWVSKPAKPRLESWLWKGSAMWLWSPTRSLWGSISSSLQWR